MKKRFREGPSSFDAPLSDEGDDGSASEEAPAPSSFLSRLMQKSQMREEDDDADPVPVPQSMMSFSSGRSSMLSGGAGASDAPRPQQGHAAELAAPNVVAAQSELHSGGGGDGAAVVAAPSLAAAVASGGDSSALWSRPVAPPTFSDQRTPTTTAMTATAAAPTVSAEDDQDKYVGAAELDEEGVPKILLYCMCRQPWNPNKFMIACDYCDEWYHDSCLGMSQEELEKIDKYECMWCVEKRKRKEQRRRVWENDRAAKKAQRKAKRAQRRRELTVTKKLRAKPCKNTECAQRSRPTSKYCSDACGLAVAAQLQATRQLRRIQDTVATVHATQTEQLREFVEHHPDYLSSATKSVSTEGDLKRIAEAEARIAETSAQLAAAERDLDEVAGRVKAVEPTTSKPLAPTRDDEHGANRLDCAVCGKDVHVMAYVGHMRDCIQRNEEFSHSTVTQNPGLCNVLSRRTNRYCSQPKATCAFHSAGALVDYQFVQCGYSDGAGGPVCRVPALQCFAHADWRDVQLKGAKLRVATLKQALAAAQEQLAMAQQRVAYRAMAAAKGCARTVRAGQ